MPSSSSSSELPSSINTNLNTLLAPWLYGSMVSSVLLGILIVLVSMYFIRFSRRDNWFIKTTVLLLLCCSLVVWGGLLYLLQYRFLDHWGGTLSLHAWPLSVFIPLAAPAFSAILSQGLFGFRLWSLSGRSRLVAVAIVVLMAINLAAGLTAIGIEGDDVNGIPLNGNDLILFIAAIGEHARYGFWRIIIANEAFLWISACTDLVLSAALVYFLLTRRTKSGHGSEEMDAVVKRVLILGCTSGMITALFSVVTALLVVATISSNNVSQGLILQLSHVYAITCLASLNLRSSLAPTTKGATTSRSLSRSARTRGHEASGSGDGSLSLVKSRTRQINDLESGEHGSKIAYARSPVVGPPPDMMATLLQTRPVAQEPQMAERDPLQVGPASYFVPRPSTPSRAPSNGSFRAAAAAAPTPAPAPAPARPAPALHPLVTDLSGYRAQNGQPNGQWKVHGHGKLPSASYASPLSAVRDRLRG